MPASILARVPLEMSRPTLWHLAESWSWERSSWLLSLRIWLPVMFVGKSSAPFMELDSNALLDLNCSVNGASLIVNYGRQG